MTKRRAALDPANSPIPLGAGGMSIAEAMDHSALFGPFFPGATWGAWRVALKALFGLPMTDSEAAVYRHHTGRDALPTQPFSEATWIVGRRGGKSRVLATTSVYLATFRDYVPMLAPGEIATVAVIAADRRQARQILRYALGLLRANPTLAAMITGETAESIDLGALRVVIEVTTASYRVTRGYTFIAVLADELAFWPTDDAANPDVEILAAVRPGLATLRGMLLKCSSPYARRGELWNDFRRHFGKDDARVLVWRGTTLEMNPSLDPAIVADAYEADPASAAAEYGAEFRSDIETYVAREIVDAVVVTGRHELPPMAGTGYHAFVDPSGGSSDSMTLAIGHRDADGRAILDALRERRPPFSPDEVVQDFADLLRSYGVFSVTGDRYAGEWPRERFRVHGIAYDPAPKPKSDVYRDFLPVLNSARVEILDHPRLISQLCGLERRTARGGRDSIDHAPGAHDDIANAAAGVLVGLAGEMDTVAQWANANADRFFIDVQNAFGGQL